MRAPAHRQRSRAPLRPGPVNPFQHPLSPPVPLRWVPPDRPLALSSGRKYPKPAGAFRCAPDPWRLLLGTLKVPAGGHPRISRATASTDGAILLRLLGRQGSGGFLPFLGGPPARFGDFPSVESHIRPSPVLRWKGTSSPSFGGKEHPPVPRSLTSAPAESTPAAPPAWLPPTRAP